MKLSSCDFCPKSKARPRGDCLSTTVDGRVYDICPDCKAKREAQLQGKGVNAPESLSFRIGGWPSNYTLCDYNNAAGTASYGTNWTSMLPPNSAVGN